MRQPHQPPTPREAAAEATVARLRAELADAEAELVAATTEGDRKRFRDHLTWAAREVASWPAWKRGALGRIDR